MSYYFTFVKPEHYQSIYDFRKELLECDSSFDGNIGLRDYENIEQWDFNNKLFENESTVPPGYAISFQYLYMENNEAVGMVHFRPHIETYPFLSQYAGHIGYNVRPSKRNKGIGTKMLKEFLPIAKSYGLEKVMLSCLIDNDASRKIIINNGGILEETVIYPPKDKMIEKYWINL